MIRTMSIARYGWMFMAPAIAASAFTVKTFSQQPRTPQLPAPPPMRFVSRSERSQLNSAKDPKGRLRATIALGEEHLARAEAFTQSQKFDMASEELGSYLGLIDDVRAFAASMDRDKGSTRDLYRHLEMAVRPHLPRLAVMRRATPAQYSGNIRNAEEYLKDARAEALDSFYGHTVIRDVSVPGAKPDSQKPSAEGPKRP
jgi:hypothetical protein